MKRWQSYQSGHEWVMDPKNRWDPDYDDRCATVNKRGSKFAAVADGLAEEIQCCPIDLRDLARQCAEGKPDAD